MARPTLEAAARGTVLALAALAAGAAARHAAAQAEVPVIEHQTLRCVVKDRFARVEAVVRPAAQVTHARVYFTSSAGDAYYSVEMTPLDGERFEARLPKPKQKAGPLHYFLEVLSANGALQRTAEAKVEVVKKAADCGEPERVAELAEGGGDVTLHASTAEAGKPRGFGGVARIIAPPAPPPAAESAEAKPAETAPVAEPPAAAPVLTPVASAAPPASPAPAPAPPPEPSPQPAVAPSADATRPAEPQGRVEYAIGLDDIVKIVVVGHDDLAQTLLVQQDGTFIFPLLGRVQVAELTPSQLEKQLATRLAQGYIRNPQVSVTVQEYRSKTVMVMGEVARPGPYPLSGSLRIVEILAKAGMQSHAGTQVQVLRPLGPTDRPLLPAELGGADADAGKQAEILEVDLRAIQLGDLDKNILLRPNDTVYVPPADKFYVTGEARSPGAYTLRPGLTVREAVILAGGFSDNASMGRTRVIREVEGQKREIKVKLDDPVEPGDIIVVKGKLF